MAQTTYNPDDANCTGWKGEGTATPANLAEFQDTEYSGAEKTKVSVDNTEYVEIGAITNVPGHQVQFTPTDSNITQMAVTAKTASQNGQVTLELFIYNSDSSTWESLDSQGSAEVGVKYTLTGTISANISYYNDATNKVQVAVTDDNNGDLINLYYAELVVTHGVDAPAFDGRGLFLYQAVP